MGGNWWLVVGGPSVGGGAGLTVGIAGVGFGLLQAVRSRVMEMMVI